MLLFPALKRVLNNVLILEDDYDFCNNIDSFNIELTRFLTNAADWNVLLLDVSEHGPPVNIKTTLDDVYINLWSQSAAAYIMRRLVFKDYLNVLRRTARTILKQPSHDFYWNSLKAKYKWYVNKKILGSQRESYSDIGKKVANSKKDIDSFFY